MQQNGPCQHTKLACKNTRYCNFCTLAGISLAMSRSMMGKNGGQFSSIGTLAAPSKIGGNANDHTSVFNLNKVTTQTPLTV